MRTFAAVVSLLLVVVVLDATAQSVKPPAKAEYGVPDGLFASE